MKINRNKILLFFIIAIYNLPAVSQQNDSSEETFLGIGSGNRRISKFQKSSIFPLNTDSITIIENIKYYLEPKQQLISYKIEDIKPARLKITANGEKLYRGYLKAGIGNYLTPLLDLNYASKRSRDESWGLNSNTHGSFSSIKDMGNTKYSDFILGGYYQKFFLNYDFWSEIKYQRNSFQLYGIDYNDSLMYQFYDVDFNKRTDLDVKDMTAPEANKEIDNLMSQGYGTIVIKNPQGKHSLGVGILNKLNLIFEGSLGYFGMGSCDGPTVRINGRVGWSCAENLMAGKVVIEKNAGSCFGAAIRGGDLICKGSVGARTGIDMKGGTIIIGGDAGAFTGFMMQRGRIIILGDVGINLGDSMYDGTIFIGGSIGSYGSDAVDAELTKSDQDWLTRKLKVAEIGENFDVSKMKKIVAGKKLWNYDNLEPTEKKGAI